MPRRIYECIICGRKFPEGQGIIIDYDGVLLAFHSSRCAAKFLKQLLERVPPEELKGYIKRLVEEDLEAVRARRKLREKKI